MRLRNPGRLHNIRADLRRLVAAIEQLEQTIAAAQAIIAAAPAKKQTIMQNYL